MTAEVVGDAPGVVPLGEVGGVPVRVLRALRLLKRVERERAARARRWADARACDLATGDDALTVIEASETVKAWADAVALAATGRVVEVLDEEDDRYAAPRVGAADRSELVDTATSEIAAATGLGEREVARRVGLAVAAPERSEPLVSAMRTRGVPLFRAVTVLEGTAGIETEDLPEVYEKVLADRRDGTPPSPAQLRTRIRAQVLRHDAGCDERARTTALRERTAWVRPHPEGTATFAVTGDAGRCTAALDRVDSIARALKAAGHGGAPAGPASSERFHDERTLAQLRSDVVLDLILYGQVVGAGTAPATGTTIAEAPSADDENCPPEHGTTPAGGGSEHATTAVDGDDCTDSDSQAVAPRPLPPVGACDLPVLGQLPPAVTHVTIALTTLLGLDDDLAQVRGIGALTAAHARELATAAGSVWRRLVTDPLTAQAITLDRRRYRPPASVADDVRVRDGVCRGVGCTLDAWRCDLDHVISWNTGGTTGPDNLVPLHRHHHQLKTRGRWRSTLAPDGTLTWTSPLGRTYLTDPATYGEPRPGPPARERARPAPPDPDPPPF